MDSRDTRSYLKTPRNRVARHFAIGSSSRVARLDQSHILNDEGFLEAVRKVAAARQQSYPAVAKYAKQCLDELAVYPRDRYLEWVARLARFIYTRSFEPELDVNVEALETLKELAGEKPMVFLWSHKSHLDSFVFMRAMYDANFRPQPLSFAGINMNFAGFGALAKRSGAIFLRRSFKDDEVYKLVLKHYIDYLVSKRVPLSWSIEGTRSRTGKLMPPKLGLIQWVLDSYRRASCDDALLVPVAITFDQIPEIDDYVAMQRGLPKRKESLRWFIAFIAGMRARHGRIYVRFAEPVALSDDVPVSTSLLGDQPERALARRLALAVCNRIEQATPITGTDLVTLILLASDDRALDEQQIQEHALEIMDLIQQRALPTTKDLQLARTTGFRSILQALTRTGLLRCFDKGAQPVYVITPGQHLAAAYYRNTIAHYFLSGAMAELALASTEHEPAEETVWTTVIALRDLLKFEFFFKPKEGFRQDVAGFLDCRYGDWRRTRPQGFKHRFPLFGHAILRSFIEGYWVLARVLEASDASAIKPHKNELVRACLSRGEELLLRGQIHSEAALSEPLFANAIELADHRGLLADDFDKLKVRRAEFAAEVHRFLAAVNHLQQRYDQALIPA